jgi:hypothetical protein
MNTLERFYMYNFSPDKFRTNDTHTEKHSPIFNLVRNHYAKRMQSDKTNPQTKSLTLTSPHHIHSLPHSLLTTCIYNATHNTPDTNRYNNDSNHMIQNGGKCMKPYTHNHPYV